eukprot:7382865-Prymnesium_polylepis.2
MMWCACTRGRAARAVGRPARRLIRAITLRAVEAWALGQAGRPSGNKSPLPRPTTAAVLRTTARCAPYSSSHPDEYNLHPTPPTPPPTIPTTSPAFPYPLLLPLPTLLSCHRACLQLQLEAQRLVPHLHRLEQRAHVLVAL